MADAFEQYRKETGKRHPEDRETVSPPDGLTYLYDWFWEVAQGRPFGPEGTLLPIPSAEINAWAQLGGHRLEAWEVTGLRALDAAYLTIAGEK